MSMLEFFVGNDADDVFFCLPKLIVSGGGQDDILGNNFTVSTFLLDEVNIMQQWKQM